MGIFKSILKNYVIEAVTASEAEYAGEEGKSSEKLEFALATLYTIMPWWLKMICSNATIKSMIEEWAVKLVNSITEKLKKAQNKK